MKLGLLIVHCVLFTSAIEAKPVQCTQESVDECQGEVFVSRSQEDAEQE